MMKASSLRPGDVIHIEKWTPDGQSVISYDGWLIADDDPILIFARWERPDLPLPYVTFAHGDLLLEAYYRDRPYNIFALFDGRNAPVDIDWGKAITRSNAIRPTLQSLAPLCQNVGVRCPLKGHYINFTRPVYFVPAQRKLVWQDLALDIWLPAEGDPLVLDADEYRALNLSQTEPELARSIEQIRERILQDRLAF